MSSPGTSPEIQVVLDAIYENLVAGYDKAKQETDSLASSVNAASRSMASAAPAATRFFSETRTGSAHIINTSRALQKMKDDMENAGEGAGHLSGSVSTATREFRALFDEVTAGRWHNVPGTMAIIANRVFGISGAALLAGVGVVGLAAGLGYLAYRADAAAAAITRMDLGAQFASDLGVTRGELQQTASQVEDFGNISKKEAEQIVSAWANVGNQSTAQIQALSLATVNYMQATGDKGPEVVKKLTKALDDQKLTVADLAAIFPGITTKEAENYIQVAKLGDQHQKTAALVQLLQERTKGLGGDIVELNSRTFASIGNFTRMTAAMIEDVSAGFIPLSHAIEGGIKLWDQYGGAIKGALSWLHQWGAALGMTSQMDRVHGDIVDENTKRYHNQTAATSAAARAAQAQRDSSDQELQAALKLGTGLVSTAGHVKQLTTEINTWKKALADNPNAPAATVEALKDRIAAAQEQIDAIRERGARKGATALRQEGEMEIAQAKETISEIQANEELGAQEKLTAIRKVWADLLAGGRFNARQRLQIETELHNEEAAINKQADATGLAIDKSNAETDVELAKIAFNEKKEILQQEVNEHKITRQAMLNELKADLQHQEDLEIAAVTAAEVGYDADTAYFQEQENRKRIIRAQTVAEMRKYDAEIAQADNQTARESAEYYKKAFSEVTSAEDTMVENITSGQKSLWASLGLAVGDFVKKEIEADLHYLTAHLFYNQAELAADKSLGQEGLLWHLATETQKTAATTAGATARTAVTATAAATSNAVEAASDQKSIINSAYTAAAAAYKSVMQAVPPPVNLVLAPVAAAGTFAAVMAYDAITSLDVGAWNVPRDMMAPIHEGEMVVPKTYSQGMREAAMGGAMASPGSMAGGVNHWNVTYAPNIQHHQPASLEDLVAKDSSFMIAWFQARVRDGDIKIPRH